MSAEQATATPAIDSGFGQLQHNWGWLLAAGILSVVLGTIGLGMSLALTLASVLFFGVFLVIGGVIELVQAFKSRGWKSFVLHVGIAGLHIVAGVVIMADPLVASSLLTLLLAGAIIGIGGARIVMALQHRDTSGWPLCLLSGVVSLALGAMIISHWPVSGMWVIGLFVAVELIMNGFSEITLALAARAAG
ncbi:MAG: HdeD family acid-resistance protein [Candidatus Binatia bacterium]